MAEPVHVNVAQPEPGLLDAVIGLRARSQQAKRDPPSGFLDVDVPVDAESVRQPAGSAPGLIGKRHLHLSAIGQPVEDGQQVRPVAAADLQADVLTDLGRVLGMAVGGDDDDAVQLELRVHDAVALSRGDGPAVLVGGDHLELAPEDFVVVLHGFASLALEVDVRGEIDLGHVGSPLDGMLGGMGAASTMYDRSQRANVTAAKMSTWRNPLEVALVGPVGHTAASASWV